MEDSEEPKDLLSSIVDGIREAIDKVLGREGEGEEGEEAKTGLQKIIEDITKWHKDLWDNLLGREGEEGEEGGFDLAKIIKDIRNQVRDFLGMEPLPEE